MTWAELKQEIRDLGFEDDSTMEDYSTIVINASNRAIEGVIDSAVIPLEGYFKIKLSSYNSDGTVNKEWKIPSVAKITSSTADTSVINLPDRVIKLVPLLASYFVWLDDDIQKATAYFNMYDSMKTDLVNALSRPVKCVIGDGLWW